MVIYSLHGLTIESAIELPELFRHAIVPSRHEPIVIKNGQVPHDLAGAKISKEGYLVTCDKAILRLGDAIEVLVSDGKLITFQAAAGVKEEILRLFLLSAAIGCALHQRGFFPLHATAIERGGDCFVFSGNSGDGKSTLAAGFSRRRFRLLSDDLVVPHESPGGTYKVWPSVPILHLFGEAVLKSGLGKPDLPGNSWRFGKNIYIAKSLYAQSPAILKRIYFLDWSEGEDSLSIKRMDPSSALLRLRRNVSLQSVIPLMQREALFLSWAERMVRQLPAFHLLRPRKYASFSSSLDLIEQHVTQD